MFEISKQFRFEAAHSLVTTVAAEQNRRVHGHSYRAEVTLRGEPDAASGMVIDLAELETVLGTIQNGLDHRLLDEVPGLGPATLENLCLWIWRAAASRMAGLCRVTVFRDSVGDRCSYHGPGGGGA